MDDQELRRRILLGNIERQRPDLGEAEKRRALEVAEIAFRGNVGNGLAAEIGVRAVLREREEGR